MLLKFPSWKWSINHAVADCKVLIIRWNAWQRENVTTGQGFLLFENQWNIWEWTVRQLNIFLFCLLLFFFSSLLRASSLALQGSFLYSKLVLVHLALILLSQAWIYPQSVQLPPNDGNQFSQEIRTSMTSRASSSRLIRPIWTTDKSKRFLLLVPSPEIPLKICSCLLQSAPQFFYWCCFLVVVVVVGGSTRGCACLEQCAGREWCRSPG